MKAFIQRRNYLEITSAHYSNSTNRHTALYIYSVLSVLWALLSVQQGQRYCRQTIVHYSNSTNRHTALYIYSVPSVLWALLSVQQGHRYCRQTIGHYSNSTNRHTALYIYRAAQTVCFCSSVTVSCTQRSDTGCVYIMCTAVYSYCIEQKYCNTFMLYEANITLCTEYSDQWCC